MSVNTHHRLTDAKNFRVDKKTRAAQQRLADKSFTEFVRQHNQKVAS